MKLIVLALLLVPLLPAAADVMELAGYRDWTSSDGNKLNALLLEIGPNSYSLKSQRDGRTYEIPVDRISDEDKRLVQQATTFIDGVARKAVSASGTFTTLGDPSEEFWRLVKALGRFREFAQLVGGDYESSSGVVKLVAGNFRRESNKSFLIEGDGIMIRVLVTGDQDNIVEMGEKLQVTRKVRSRSSRYSYYGWYYDNRLDVLRKDICISKKPFQPTIGSKAPYKLLTCSAETIGAGDYLVFTLQAQFGH